MGVYLEAEPSGRVRGGSAEWACTWKQCRVGVYVEAVPSGRVPGGSA